MTFLSEKLQSIFILIAVSNLYTVILSIFLIVNKMDK